jgi:hypothetical protein
MACALSKLRAAMQYAIVLSLCVVAASPVAPSREVEVEAAARAFRIESYNRCREDRERYQQLRDADDDLRVGLTAVKEHELASRQEEAVRWYREATAAVHADRDVPASPAWLSEALADAAARKLREKPSPIAARTTKKTPTKPAFSSNVLPPQLEPAKPGDQAADAEKVNVETPFFFVNAALKAMGGLEPGSVKIDDVKEPVIHPAGPIVDGRVQEPESAPVKGSAGKSADSQGEPMVEPTLELPTLGAEAVERSTVEAPAIELPELSSN